MSELYDKSLLKLELDRVLEMLAACAGSVQAKEVCVNLRPVSDLDTVNEMLQETTDAFNLTSRKGYPGFAGNVDVSGYVEHTNIGGSLQPKELLQIAGALRCARKVKDYISEETEQTSITDYFAALVPNKHLEERISASFLSEDEVADAASPALADIHISYPRLLDAYCSL